MVPNYEPEEHVHVSLIGFMPRWGCRSTPASPFLGWAWSWDGHLPKVCSTLLPSSPLHPPQVQAVSREQWRDQACACHQRVLGERDRCLSEAGKELVCSFNSWRFTRGRWCLGRRWEIRLHKVYSHHRHWLPAATPHTVPRSCAQPVKGHTNPTQALHLCIFIYLLVTHNWWASEGQPEGAC